MLEFIKSSLVSYTFGEAKVKEHFEDNCGICLLDFDETNDTEENMAIMSTP